MERSRIRVSAPTLTKPVWIYSNLKGRTTVTSWVRNEVYTGDMLYIVYLLRSTVHTTALQFAVILLIHSTFVQCSEENIWWLKAVFMGTPWCILWSRLVVSIVLIWLAPRASVSLEPVAKTDNVTG